MPSWTGSGLKQPGRRCRSRATNRATERPHAAIAGGKGTPYRVHGPGAGLVRAVDGISYTVEQGETVAIVGESGSGKSVGALSILRLIPDPPGRITAGEILFDGRDLRGLSEAEMRQIRGRDIGMVFQEPMTSLNPVLTIGRQITETLRAAPGRRSRRRRERRALELLEMVGIADPARRLQAVSASALRRHAPAGDDRHRARLQSQADHRRRADHGARRHHPGADPGADEVADAPAQRRADHHHPQSRRGRPLRQPGQRDVCRPHRRERQRRRDLSRPAASLHDGAAALGAAARPAAPGAPRSGRRPAARPDAARRRLRLPPALPLRRRRAAPQAQPPLERAGEAGHLAACFRSAELAAPRRTSRHERRRARDRRRSSRCAASPCTSPFPRAIVLSAARSAT